MQYLELDELVRLEFVSGQDEPDNVLWEKGEGSQVENLVSVVVDKLKDFGHQALGALVLDVSFRSGQEGTNSVHRNAALDESGAGAFQLLKAVVVSGIHHSCLKMTCSYQKHI